jgi:hypothetical protein
MVIKDIKVGVMVAAGQALDYKKKKPSADIEEIMGYVLANVEANSEATRGVVAGATKAVAYREQNPKMTDKEIMQRVMDDINDMVASLEEE